jgi:hypothetical protein
MDQPLHNNDSNNVDAVSLQHKYDEERKKRTGGGSQYIDLQTSQEFHHFQDDPWIDTNAMDIENPALVDGSSM